MQQRTLFLVYGLGAYALFLATFLYAIGFLADWLVPRTIDTGPESPTGVALAIDLALLGLFAVQHSVMARPAFKRLWTRAVPAPIERSTYVLLSSLCLALLFWQWRPITGVVWENEGSVASVLWGLFALGWLLLLVSTFLIDHFDLFGLRQVVQFFRGRAGPPISLRAPLFYRFVRHPIMLAWLIIFWSAARMTAGHLLFAAVTTLYILAAIQLEERDLMGFHGEAYSEYRRRVPMLLPFLKRDRLRGPRRDRGPDPRVVG